MGGCYDRDVSYSRPVIRDTALDGIKEFFKTGERPSLLSAYRQMLQEGTGIGFIQKLHQAKGITTAPKEFSEYELEAKFDIALIPSGKPKKQPRLEELMNTFDFQPTSGAAFLKDPVNVVSTGINRFYGTEDGEERLVVITKGGHTFKKEKGNHEPLHYGLPLEKYILKRSETRVPATTEDIEDALMRLNSDGKLKKIGSLEKTKADFFVINTLSGREYGCTVSQAYRLPQKKDVQMQLEIEYAGYTPGFPAINIKNEREIATEMSQLLTTILLSYGMNPVQVNKEWSLQVRPTVERKFDFASGKQGLAVREPADILPFALTGQKVQ